MLAVRLATNENSSERAYTLRVAQFPSKMYRHSQFGICLGYPHENHFDLKYARTSSKVYHFVFCYYVRKRSSRLTLYFTRPFLFIRSTVYDLSYRQFQNGVILDCKNIYVFVTIVLCSTAGTIQNISVTNVRVTLLLFRYL